MNNQIINILIQQYKDEKIRHNLKSIQDIFINKKDWDEVLNIQIEIDKLLPSPPIIYPWFKYILLKIIFDNLKKQLDMIE